MKLLVAGLVQMVHVFCTLGATGFERNNVMGLQFFAIEQVFATDRTLPVLVFSYSVQFRSFRPV